MVNILLHIVQICFPFFLCYCSIHTSMGNLWFFYTDKLLPIKPPQAVPPLGWNCSFVLCQTEVLLWWWITVLVPKLLHCHFWGACVLTKMTTTTNTNYNGVQQTDGPVNAEAICTQTQRASTHRNCCWSSVLMTRHNLKNRSDQRRKRHAFVMTLLSFGFIIRDLQEMKAIISTIR